MTQNQLIRKRTALGMTQKSLAEEISEKIFMGKRTIGRKAIGAMENGINPVAWYVDLFFERLK